MTSQDSTNYVTVETFNDGIAAINQRLDKIDQKMTEMRYEMRYNARDIEHLQTSVYWGFALLGIIIALVQLFKREKSEQPKPNITRSDVQTMIDAAISKALGVKNQ